MKTEATSSQPEKSTFVVKVEHCRNESWQGEVIWAEEGRREKFRSALELIMLMDEAVKTTAECNNTQGCIKRA